MHKTKINKIYEYNSILLFFNVLVRKVVENKIFKIKSSLKKLNHY